MTRVTKLKVAVNMADSNNLMIKQTNKNKDPGTDNESQKLTDFQGSHFVCQGEGQMLAGGRGCVFE